MRISIFAIGSRGDVQPLVALALGLREAGHVPCLIAGTDFQEFITAYGLEFCSLGLRIQDTMQAHTNIFQFAKSITPHILAAFESGGTPDAIMATVLGVSTCQLARDRGIPFFYVLPSPGERTRYFPYPMLPALPLGGVYNDLTHRLMEKLIRISYPPINCLFELPRPTYLHCFSEQVIPRPPDWGDHVHVTGYWFLPRPTSWQPPADLVSFLDAGSPPVCVGFGSMVDQEAETVTKIVLDALAQTDQRGILVTGWGGLSQSHVSENVCLVKSIPYDWLFPRVAAVVHHGGAGTVAWALLAGIPSVTVPFGLDQPFWGKRVQALGVGTAPIPRKRLTAERLAAAIRQAASDPVMRTRAQTISKKIQAETGIKNAVDIIEQVVSERKEAGVR